MLAHKTFTEALTIKCKYSILPDYREHSNKTIFMSNVYQCDGKIWTICDKSPICIGVSNDHQAGKTNYHVDFLELLLYNYGPRIPIGINKFFWNLRGLKMPYGTIEEISSDDLRYPRLQTLYLGHNRIRTLDSDLFKHNKHLLFIGLENNQITNVGSQIFDNLKALMVVYLTNNPCTNNRSYGTAFNINLPGGEKLDSYKYNVRRNCPETQQMIDRVKERQFNADEDKEDESLAVRSDTSEGVDDTPLANYNECQKYFFGRVQAESLVRKAIT